MTWQQARNSCLAVQGSDLISIHSSQEQLFLARQMTDLKSGNVWIGLNDIDNEGVFLWSDRTPFKYTNWGRYEPGSGWSAYYSDCSKMIAYSQNATWGTSSCQSRNPYICKMPRGKIKSGKTKGEKIEHSVTLYTNYIQRMLSLLLFEQYMSLVQS